MHAVDSKKVDVDKALNNMAFGPAARLVYITFRGNDTKGRSELLHRNNLLNVKASYEFLHRVKMFDKAVYNGVEESVRQLLIGIKLQNRKLLFLGLE